LNHREAWALEHKAPTKEEWAKILAAENEPKKRQTVEEPKSDAATPAATENKPSRVILRRK
jgi:hypothetical protein